MSSLGTVVRGIRTGVIKEGDNLKEIVVNSVINASLENNFELNDKDIVAITEAVVGISEKNYASVDDISFDVKNRFKTNHIGIVYPILSRNRFAILLKSFARSMDKLTILLSYPSDEVGNDIMDKETLNLSKLPIDNYVINESVYYEKFGSFKHIFTGVNMVDFYKDICNKENCEVEFIFSNNPEVILEYTKDVLVSDIHTRFDTKKRIKSKGGNIVLGLDDILTSSVNGSGYNSKYGLLGSNRSTEDKVKLFPEHSEELVYDIQKEFKKRIGKDIEVMVYGDGAFKDPVGKIWELADPVVSPGYTKGLEGSPNEIKLKYISDNKYPNLRGEELNNAIKEEIKEKSNDLKGTISSQGTTPRRYVDLIGSLCDLTSGSGDKGTPVILVQDYFKNYAD